MFALSLLWTNAITYENPGIRLELFLKELSKQSGTELHCTPYLNNEVIVAAFENQTVDVLKKQLSKVTNGTWEERKDGWWLVQTSDQRKAEERFVDTQRNLILQTQMDGLRAIAPKAEWTAKDAEKFFLDTQASRKRTGEGIWNSNQRKALRLRSPESRFVENFASKITPQAIYVSPLVPRETFFSLRPLATQLPLKVDVSAALQQLNHEMELLRTLGYEYDGGTNATNIEVRCDSQEVPILDVSVYDQNWKFVTSAFPSLFLPVNFTAKPEAFAPSKTTQEIYNLRQTFSNMYGESEEGNELRKTPTYQAILATFKNATVTDPLGILQGRYWIDYARTQHKPLLVNLEDDAVTRRPKNYVPAVAQPDVSIGMKRLDDENWILGAPVNPVHNRTWRIDRSLVQRYAREQLQIDKSNIAAVLAKKDLLCYAGIYTTGIPNGDFLDAYNDIDDLVYAAIGTMTPAQLNTCLQGGRVAVSALPERGQLYIQQNVDSGNENSISPVVAKMPEYYCPRYCFPNGISGMQLSAQKIQADFYSFVENVSDTLGLDEGDGLGLTNFAHAINQAIKTSSPLLKKKFIVSSVQTLQCSLILGNKSQVHGLELGRTDTPAYTWETLPATYKNQVLEAMKGLDGN